MKAHNTENFMNMSIGMEQVTTNYLEGEQRLCDSWAACINSRKMNMAEAIRSVEDSKEKTRLLATCFDAWVWDGNTGDSIMVNFLNTKRGFPGNPGLTEEDYLNLVIKQQFEEFKIVKNEISKVTLGGKEYTRAELNMEIEGKKSFMYIYARKLDDNLMVEIEAGGISGKTTDDVEKMFE